MDACHNAHRGKMEEVKQMANEQDDLSTSSTTRLAAGVPKISIAPHLFGTKKQRSSSSIVDP